ncbi:MAG: hypothetical protein HRU41_27785 [Saprospiraceae bacterium]|nr:hypothetical protein [Saprospiraceae bacterium]
MKKQSVFTSLLFCILLVPFSSATEANLAKDFGGAYLVFANKMGGELTVKTLQSACVLEVAGCAKGSQIFSFRLNVYQNGKRTMFQVNNSNELSSEMRESLAKLKPGDSFEFKQIKAYLPNGRDKVDVFAKRFKLVERMS